ncbi:hypothetical protein AB0J80_11870 [Actinoplanes sp. NPDC049548]|uniref:hypothetical protein n=1 Tax=Actinoplanes sp. NPDC049548 TaxID=3155152 RepID=UPI00343B3D12
MDLTANGEGYLLMSDRGEFYAFGNARAWPNPTGFSGAMTGVSITGDGQGALAVSSAGQFYAYGSARSWPNPTGFAGRIVGVSVTADGRGALAMSSAGQFYAYGTAHAWPNPTGFSGSMVSVSVTADGQGAIAMSSTGQFYAYGTARPQQNPSGFTGSMVSAALSADGGGVMAMSSAGQFYAYGSARPQLNPSGFTGGMAAVALTDDGRGTLAMSGIGQTYAYGNARSLGNGDPGSTGGAAADYAREILNNRNIDKSGRLVNADLQAAANGRSGSAGAPLSATMLGLVARVGREHTVTITALEGGGTGHSANSLHYAGDAVDFGRLDGHVLTGRDDHSMVIIELMASRLPRGSGFGQAYQLVRNRDGSTTKRSCGPNRAALPAGVVEFADTCNHLHVQVPRGTA